MGKRINPDMLQITDSIHCSIHIAMDEKTHKEVPNYCISDKFAKPSYITAPNTEPITSILVDLRREIKRDSGM